jgi:hypothetical protein
MAKKASTGDAKSLVSDVERLRKRLRTMTDSELRDFGNGVRKLCQAARRLDQEPGAENTTHLEEASTEWLRRHSRKARITE